jgi:hypothetical protein
MKLCVFDLEIAKILPEDCDDWWAEAPLGISCAATLVIDEHGGEDLKLWYGKPNARGVYAPCMTGVESRQLATYIYQMEEYGYTIVTWNGASFDFRLLADECQKGPYAVGLKGMALRHTDPAFAMLCSQGFMIGMDTACKGMGLEGKPEGMHGALAPELWAQGYEECRQVLDYVAQDVRMEAALYREITEKGYIHWTSQSGVDRTWMLEGHHIRTVEEAMELPLPDTSWMSKPMKREKCVGWIVGRP